MIEKHLYECEFCGKTFEYAEDAQNCEWKHLIDKKDITGVILKDYHNRIISFDKDIDFENVYAFKCQNIEQFELLSQIAEYQGVGFPDNYDEDKFTCHFQYEDDWLCLEEELKHIREKIADIDKLDSGF